jgi:hypothetical protein
MKAREAPDADRFDAIPDPLAGLPEAPPPRAVLPAYPSPTRDERRRTQRLALGFTAAWVVASLLVFGVRSDVGAPKVVSNLVAFGLAGVLGFAFLFRPRGRGLPASVFGVRQLLWGLPATFLACAAVGAPEGLGLSPTFASVRGCLGVGTLMAVGPLVAASLALERAFVSSPGWRGAAVGALAGLAGAIGLHAHCDVPVFGHLLFGHAPVIVVGAVVGALVGRWRLRA